MGLKKKQDFLSRLNKPHKSRAGCGEGSTLAGARAPRLALPPCRPARLTTYSDLGRVLRIETAVHAVFHMETEK